MHRKNGARQLLKLVQDTTHRRSLFTASEHPSNSPQKKPLPPHQKASYDEDVGWGLRAARIAHTQAQAPAPRPEYQPESEESWGLRATPRHKPGMDLASSVPSQTKSPRTLASSSLGPVHTRKSKPTRNSAQSNVTELMQHNTEVQHPGVQTVTTDTVKSTTSDEEREMQAHSEAMKRQLQAEAIEMAKEIERELVWTRVLIRRDHANLKRTVHTTLPTPANDSRFPWFSSTPSPSLATSTLTQTDTATPQSQPRSSSSSPSPQSTTSTAPPFPSIPTPHSRYNRPPSKWKDPFALRRKGTFQLALALDAFGPTLHRQYHTSSSLSAQMKGNVKAAEAEAEEEDKEDGEALSQRDWDSINLSQTPAERAQFELLMDLKNRADALEAMQEQNLKKYQELVSSSGQGEVEDYENKLKEVLSVDADIKAQLEELEIGYKTLTEDDLEEDENEDEDEDEDEPESIAGDTVLGQLISALQATDEKMAEMSQLMVGLEDMELDDTEKAKARMHELTQELEALRDMSTSLYDQAKDLGIDVEDLFETEASGPLRQLEIIEESEKNLEFDSRHSGDRSTGANQTQNYGRRGYHTSAARFNGQPTFDSPDSSSGQAFESGLALKPESSVRRVTEDGGQRSIIKTLKPFRQGNDAPECIDISGQISPSISVPLYQSKGTSLRDMAPHLALQRETRTEPLRMTRRNLEPYWHPLAPHMNISSKVKIDTCVPFPPGTRGYLYWHASGRHLRDEVRFRILPTKQEMQHNSDLSALANRSAREYPGYDLQCPNGIPWSISYARISCDGRKYDWLQGLLLSDRIASKATMGVAKSKLHNSMLSVNPFAYLYYSWNQVIPIDLGSSNTSFAVVHPEKPVTHVKISNLFSELGDDGIYQPWSGPVFCKLERPRKKKTEVVLRIVKILKPLVQMHPSELPPPKVGDLVTSFGKPWMCDPYTLLRTDAGIASLGGLRSVLLETFPGA